MTFGQLLTNGYFYGMCACGLACIVNIVLVLRLAHASKTIVWFQLYLASILGFTILNLLQFFSLTPSAFTVVVSLTALTVPLVFTSQLAFILHFTGKRDWARRWWIRASVITVGIGFLFVAWNFHGFVLSNDIAARTLKPWGYISSTATPGFGLVSAYTGIFALIGAAILIMAYVSSRVPERRKHIMIVGVAVISPIIIGIVTQGILPHNGIYTPPIGSYSTTLAAVLIGYMLIRYGTISIDPEAIATSIVQIMNNPAVALDLHHRIIFANAATSSLLGFAPSEIITKPISYLVGQEPGKQLGEYLRSHQANNAANKTFQAEVTTRDGNKIAVNIYSSYYRDKQERVLGTVLVLADIQHLQALKAGVEQTVVERTHELHQETAKLLAAIEGLPSAFVLIDEQQSISLQNKWVQTLWNLDGPATSLKQLDAKLPNLGLEQRCKDVQQNKHPMIIEEVSLGNNILRLFLGPVRVKEGGSEATIGVVMIAEDITEAKVAERSKDEFFSIASHELRTPLTSIKGNASMLMTYLPVVADNQDAKEMATDIYDSSVRLIDIVNDFLDVSRLEQGKISFTYAVFSLEPVVEKIIYEMHAVLNEKKLYLKFDKMVLNTLPKVWADEDRTKQVLYNLIGNAAKFTETGGISVSAKVENKFIKVLVSDTGRGMSPANQQLLFHKFQQANTSLLTRDTSRGTGLGLYISKMIVESMGGAIKLEHSEEGKGSVFSFTLPIASSGDAQHAQVKAATESSSAPQSARP